VTNTHELMIYSTQVILKNISHMFDCGIPSILKQKQSHYRYPSQQIYQARIQPSHQSRLVGPQSMNWHLKLVHDTHQ